MVINLTFIKRFILFVSLGIIVSSFESIIISIIGSLILVKNSESFKSFLFNWCLYTLGSLTLSYIKDYFL